MVNSTRSSGGSSPLARGLLRVPVMLDDSFGIIPARAGFTRGLGGSGVHLGDHPRSRGVYRRACGRYHGRGGSSPLARGLQSYSLYSDQAIRIIPARAGFTRRSWWKYPSHPDHPRSRGVYQELAGRPPGRPGSSPLARGLLETGPYPPDAGRIIPARAGFTPPSSH